MDKQFARNSRLERYVRTKGTTLPRDLDYYRAPNGDKHSLCLFCNSPHDYQPIMQRDFLSREGDAGNTSIVVGVYACDKCDHIIEKNLDIIIDDQFAIEKLFQRERKSRATAISRYVREGLFPMGAHLHYQHLEPKEELFEDNFNQDKCVFCVQKIKDWTPHNFKVSVPVGVDVYHLDGGEVVVCGTCLEEIRQVIPELSYESWITNTFEKDTCNVCKKPYLITSGEADMRSINKTVGEYSCPKCAYQNLTRKGESFFFHKCNATDGRLLRYVDVKCSFCKEHMGVDQMLSPNYILKTHITPEGKVTCLDCKYEGKFPIAASVIPGFVWLFFFAKKPFAIKRSNEGIVKQYESFDNVNEMFELFNKIETGLESTDSKQSLTNPRQRSIW